MIRAAGSECRSDFRRLPAYAPAVRSLPLAIMRAKCVQGLVHPSGRNLNGVRRREAKLFPTRGVKPPCLSARSQSFVDVVFGSI